MNIYSIIGPSRVSSSLDVSITKLNSWYVDGVKTKGLLTKKLIVSSLVSFLKCNVFPIVNNGGVLATSGSNLEHKGFSHFEFGLARG